MYKKRAYLFSYFREAQAKCAASDGINGITASPYARFV
jgi:hypothetical protein